MGIFERKSQNSKNEIIDKAIMFEQLPNLPVSGKAKITNKTRTHGQFISHGAGVAEW
jgi:hypothetical protein